MAVNLWLGQTMRRLAPPPVPRRWKTPKVSVHVPCYNEPPEMMIETIQRAGASSSTRTSKS